MEVGKPTRLEHLLGPMRGAISESTGIELDYIVPTLAENFWEPNGLSDKFVLITNFSGDSLDGWEAGGGNDAKAWNAVCDVILYVRLDIDTPGSDINRLTNATLGLLPLWQNLLLGINQWMPDDSAVPPVGLLIQPARALSFSIRSRQFRETGGWVRIQTKLHFPFRQDMT